MSNWRLIGNFGVDAGLCWIGDPCYILHKDKNAKEDYDKPSKSIGEDWHGFCNIVSDMQFGMALPYDNGGPDWLGVVVHTGYGDGVYPVYAKIVDGVVVAVFIDFDDEFEKLYGSTTD